jgi:hypothetical protein
MITNGRGKSMSQLQRVLVVFAFVALLGSGVNAYGQSCPCSVWGPSVTPGTLDSGDANSIEVGVKFRADVDGVITGVRFYKSANNVGAHVGNLWTNTGTLLTSGTFTGETLSGWQQVNFSTPVPITAGTTYIASYFAPTGHYSYNTGFFTKAVDNSPLHALANGVDGPNGVFSYASASTFPTSAFNASNYWVDVVFSTTVASQAPTVTSVTPNNGAGLVSTNTTVTATFSRALDPTSVNSNTFQLADSFGNQVSATVTYNSSTLTATLQPTSPLLTATNYFMTIHGGPTEPTIRDTSGNPMPANVTSSFGTANPPGICPCTVWPSTTKPGLIDGGDAKSGEFGVRFRSDQSGYILGIRYYKSTTNTGTHKGNLWSNTGTLLAQATFTGESSSGWQQVNFATPVAIVGGTTYVASYFAPAGHYSYNAGFFTSTGVDSPPLHPLANGVDGSNGVFSYSSTTIFPTGTFNSGNYWVDVVFSTTIPGQPPTVTSFTPSNGAAGVGTAAPVTVTFSKAVDPTTITSSTFQLLDSSGTPVSAAVSYNSSTFTATLQPTAALSTSTTYTAVVRGGSTDPRIKDTAGTALAANVAWSFATVSTTQAPIVLSVAPANGEIGVSSTALVSATFSKAIDPTTVTATTFQLFDSSNNIVAASLSYNSSTFTATLQPSSALAPLTRYTAVVRGGSTDPRVKDLSGVPLPGTVSWIFTTSPAPPPPSACPCSIWRLTSGPNVTDSGENKSIEVGVKFQADADGLITGLRFYKSAANTGTHIGNLWTVGGTLLASATFAGETTSGWQQVTFNSPIPVTANTTYVASYFTTAGHYAFDQNYFATTGVDTPPLHALVTGFNGPNGVYKYNATSTFPNQSFNASNYWIDVVYVLNNSTGAPSLIATSPAAGTTGLTIGSNVSATFNEPMDTTTINSQAFQLADSVGNFVGGTVSYVAASSRLVFTPTTDLQSQTTYTATVRGTVRDIFGNALGSDVTWSFTTAAPPPNTGPGGPVLIVSSAQNPFTRYLGEILLNEGMNEFTVQDIATVTDSTLSSYDVVILGDMKLTATQASMFTGWVNGGGRLIAMHPDPQLDSLFGLSAGGGTLSDAYLVVDTTTNPGSGIVGQSMQFHGTADLYGLAGATAFATLYSDGSTATSHPAVTWFNPGVGQAAAFTYDLARSVVYTRQGNPAWSGQDRDGYIDPAVGSGQIRSDDLYYGAASFDPQPDWVDFNKIVIPQADEQQRLLVNLIEQMNMTKKPLPRFWYFPSGFKAVVIMTGDDHGAGGTSGRFDQYLADSPANCSVADWTCVRATSYIFKPSIPNYLNYVSQGFEIANHADNSPTCTNFTPTSLDQAITTQLNQFTQLYPGIPASRTNRTHCVLWSDYDSEPQILLNHGIRFDTSYYYWPGSWVNGRSGLFTGSGMPMRYADRSGNIFDVYQATTQMPDEDPWDYTPAIDTLLDNALGPQGFYGAFTMNMHTDQAQSTGSNIIVAEAQSRNVPIVSSLQMLTWLDGRNSSSFGSLSWNGSALTFTVTAGTGARNLQGMLPLDSTAGSLTSLTLNGGAVAFTTQTVKGLRYAIFSAAGGSYQATYGAGGTLSISGAITGTVSSGVALALSGAANATVTTDPAGNYTFSGLPNGQYTITPNRTGSLFNPSSRTVTLNGNNVTSIDFTSSVSPTFTISGVISGGGGSNATVTLQGAASATTTANASGSYNFVGLYNGTYSVTPANAGFNFTPSTQTVAINGGNVTANFSSAGVTPTGLATDVVVSKDNPAGSSISSTTFSTAAGNELLLAFIGGDNSGSGPNTTVTSVNGGGLTWVLVQRTNVQFGTSEIWRAFAPIKLTNASVTANFSMSVPASTISVVSFTGADYSGTNGSGAIGAIGTGSSSSGAPTASLTTTRNNSWVYGVGNDWDLAVARTPGASQNIVHQYLAPNNDTYWVQAVNTTTPLSGTTVTLNDTAPTADRYNLSIVEILPLAGAAPATSAISGNISGAGGNGATVTISGATTASVAADASGNFSFQGLTSGSYTITPTQSGFDFAPTSQNIDVSGSDVSGVNFISTASAIDLSSLALNPSALTGGSSSTATVTLAAPAPPGGAVVALSSNSASAQVASSVTVAAGTTSATFAVTTTAVASATPVTISATYNGTQTAGLTINPPSASSLSLSPISLVGGSSSTGTVTLNGPAPAGGAAVALSSNSGSAKVPASIAVGAGATTAAFTVTTTAVASSTFVTISATYNGTKTAALTVNPPSLTGVSLAPTSVVGGNSSTGTVRLNGPAPATGIVIALSDNSSAAQVPVNVTVPSGATTANFTVTTTPVASATSVTVSALYNVTRTAGLTINPPSVSSLSLSPSSVVGGSSSTGTVSLNGAAPSGGITVTLSDNSSAAALPASITVAAGTTTKTFTVTTTAVASATSVTVSATYNTTRSATLTINPGTLASLILNPSTVIGGGTSTGTVTLNGPAPSAGATLALSSNKTIAHVPSSVSIAANGTSASFTVTTSPVHTNNVRISGTYLGTTRSATLTLQ